MKSFIIILNAQYKFLKKNFKSYDDVVYILLYFFCVFYEMLFYLFKGKNFIFLIADERYIYPVIEKFSLQLFSPVSWETIPNTLMELEEWEHVTCIKNVMLVSEGTRSGLKGYLAVGTSYNYGEDVTIRGRVCFLYLNIS